MKKTKVLIAIAVSVLFLYSCSRSVTPSEAASNHYSHCRDMR